MGKIILLDNTLSNMIAAGEVVERPSSVVKELVENSLDAKATSIEVAIHDAGRTKIVVSDNGEGMDRDDAQLALKRHATSKIKTEFDLFRIKTLGFRGEALPSIASVSKMTLETSTGRGGTKIEAYEDQIAISDATARIGTTITVEELFYNTPARLKYLKSDQTETASCIESLSRLAVGHPHVSFSLSVEDKLIFKTSGRGDQLETIMQVFGTHAAKNMVPMKYSCPDFTIDGFIGKPDIAKSNRYYMITLLNGRAVYMPKIQTAIIEAYRDFLPNVRFPFTIINLKVDPSLVDVNVHPSKREIRFSKEDVLRQVLLEIIPHHLKITTLVAQPLISAIKKTTNESVVDEPISIFEPTMEYATLMPQPSLTHDAPPRTKFQAIAQIHATYIVATSQTGALLLIDQHAAAERINYEKYQAMAQTSAYIVTPLVPLIIELKPSEARLLDENKIAALHETGVTLVPFGSNTYQVSQIPIWAREDDERRYVEGLIDQIIHLDRIDTLAIRDQAIASKSCKRSLKANQSLSLAEMQKLIDDLLKTDNPYSCPHGRPTMIEFSQSELEKMFKRTGF
jgi:DNA mismatch repair protein MutL